MRLLYLDIDSLRPDHFWTVLREGGPLHTRGPLPNYLKRLRAANGRIGWRQSIRARFDMDATRAIGRSQTARI